MKKAPTDQQKLSTLIEQGRKVSRTMYGVSILYAALGDRISKHDQVDAEWIKPALEVLDSCVVDLMDWWGDRLDGAEDIA